tara:strand:+ start:6100 stop:6972 length:873 start_codon:yes stop_codon:yes gene_type:complete
MSTDVSIDTLIQNAQKLPPSPEILPKLLNIIQDENATADAIADVIQLDPVLMAQVLTLSNSVHYGFSTASENIGVAISRIGLGEVYRLVGFLVAKRLATETVSAYYLNESELWENSIASALAMESLAEFTEEHSTIAYTTGLLHAIGKLVINQLPGKRYEEIYKKIDDNNITLPEAEAAVFGFDHGQIGEALLNKWNFPASITVPIAHQFRPLRAPTHKNMSCMLHLANWIVACLGKNPGLHSWAMDMQTPAMEYITLKESDLQKILIDVETNIRIVKELLSANKAQATA